MRRFRAAPPRRRRAARSSMRAASRSAPGHILTSREALEGCYVVTVGGIGGADRVAEDKASGLALLRVHGANLKPVALAGETAEGRRDARSASPIRRRRAAAARSAAAKARVADTLALDPAPALGFDGAAALDAQGRLAGIAALKVAGRRRSGTGLRRKRDAHAGRGDPQFPRCAECARRRPRAVAASRPRRPRSSG